MTSEFPFRQQQLFDLLKGKGDVPIAGLAEALGFLADDTRQAQQRLGPLVTRLNRRLQGRKLRVAPGQLKNTYALIVLD